MKHGLVERKTRETEVSVEVTIDGKGIADISTGIGFFDHMLTALSVHSGISMNIKCHIVITPLLCFVYLIYAYMPRMI